MKRMLALVVACGFVASVVAQEIRTHALPKQVKGAVMLDQGAGTAGTCWDQSGFDINAVATIDQEFSDFPSFSSYQASDATTSGGTADSITNFYTEGFGFWGAVNQARLSTSAVTGALPTHDPAAGAVVAASYASVGGGASRVSASGLSVGLTGNDWIVLTPLTTFGTQGQEFRLVASSGIIGNPTAIRNPGGGFGFGTAWADLGVLGFGSADSSFSMSCGGGGDPCDLNGDGVYDRNDVRAAITGDYNGDGVSNFRDAIALIRDCGRP